MKSLTVIIDGERYVSMKDAKIMARSAAELIFESDDISVLDRVAIADVPKKRRGRRTKAEIEAAKKAQAEESEAIKK